MDTGTNVTMNTDSVVTMKGKTMLINNQHSYDAAFATAMNEAKQQGYKPRDACLVARDMAAKATETASPRASNQPFVDLDPRVAVDTYNARP